MTRFLLALALVATMAAPALAAPTDAGLDALVRQAIAQHPSLDRARDSARAQEARVGVAGAQYLPQVNLNAGFNRTTSVSQAQNTDPFNLGSSSIGVRQRLLDFGKTAAQVEAAEATSRASRYQVDQQRVEVAYAVRRSYLEWVRAGGIETQAREQLKAARRLLDQAQAFYGAGRRPKLDVTRAEASFRQAEAEVIAAQYAVRGAARGLSAAMGQSDPVEVVAAFPALPAVAEADADTLLRLAAERHPALAIVQARRESAEAVERGAQQARWPDLFASADYGFRSRDLTTNQNWLAGVSMSMPIFSGLAITRQQEVAQAQLEAVEAEARDQALQVQLAVERAAIALTGARERLPAVEAVLRSAEESLALAEGRYRAGVGTLIEVSDAQALRANAQAGLVRAQADIHLAVADLLRALGLTGVEA